MLLFISEVICNSNAVIRQDFRKLRFQMIDDTGTQGCWSRAKPVSHKGSVQTLVMQSRHAGAAGRLRFISNNLAGRSLVRIVEEELIAVRIIDHQEPVAP